MTKSIKKLFNEIIKNSHVNNSRVKHLINEEKFKFTKQEGNIYFGEMIREPSKLKLIEYFQFENIENRNIVLKELGYTIK